MTNPILQNLTQTNLKTMLDMVRASQNPQAMLQQIAQTNPKMREVMGMVNANGGDARSTFYKMASERGVDPESILRMLR